MARLERIRVYPVKALDGVDREQAVILEGGTLAGDREFAIYDADGEVVNGKRTARVHDLETDVDLDAGRRLSIDAPESGEQERRQFDLADPTDRERAEDWLGDVFAVEATLERDRSLGFVDRRDMGPSVVSTATLESVASWFDELTVEGVRRRLRTNLEVSGVPAFWEDRFVGADAPALSIGDVTLEGVTPCGRCVVPERDPESGEREPDFRSRFVERRETAFPEWADPDAFDHYYTVTIITRVHEADRGTTLRVGDEVQALE
ncbi:MOSC domain-containing protein [Natrarchaeobaculum aegyptiacum]|uniref:Molybdenum cofactor biosysynthesis protein n=1 Tax=Natrarchaeobaculum aegyptiacum TaxID=745377 RepID=A0A2Z2HT00_9EURY|nr:MOSC N-terminal beta barrel domain-containing protein [Natrarchaeobaculum aegyptiacum]ARS89235.1 molybdenum cofactor biosysynthesis protein [Natrarchaeobaculum aegyptiacum]